MANPKCCGFDSRWVENVPGKGYFYCGECRKEVVESDILSESGGQVNTTKLCWCSYEERCLVCRYKDSVANSTNSTNCTCTDSVMCTECFIATSSVGIYYSFTTSMYENDSVGGV